MRSASKTEWEDMQGLILSAYPHLDQAAYCLVRIDDPAQTQQWLTNLLKQKAITNASRERRRNDPQNVNIALTYRGLVKMCGVIGEKPAGFSGFSNAFVEGIDGYPYRSRILGDIGRSRPEAWRWGGRRRPVDALVMLFADKSVSLPSAVGRLFAESGTTQLPLYARSLAASARREHFGFVDGISQPILRGTADAERFPHSTHLTELGEVVFGYRDALDTMASSPTLGGYTRGLPEKTEDDKEKNKFGANGSYLVFRQLRQSVSMFWNFVAAAVGTPGNPESAAARQLAAKIVGRQMDGTPLVPYVNVEDNEFHFAHDPHGTGCPIGAHIRRSNPRDSTSTDLAQNPRNRHRVLRRGRSYGEPIDRDCGLLFLCLNSDFERQFEFIHQNWTNDPGFGGLAHERDPLVGAHDADTPPRAVFTIPALPGPTRVFNLPRFVTVRGGEYFFLPGIRALKYLAGVP